MFKVAGGHILADSQVAPWAVKQSTSTFRTCRLSKTDGIRLQANPERLARAYKKNPRYQEYDSSIQADFNVHVRME